MEFLFELLFELVIEGSVEIGTERRIPMPIRIIAALLFFGFYIGIIAVFIYLAFCAMETKPGIGWLLVALSVFLAVGCIYMFVKRWRENRNS